MDKKKGQVTKGMVRPKIQRYCAYQERCHSEVRQRLLDYGVRGDDLEELIYELIQDNFLNEERFARTYAGGKFRIKQWGRQKIRQALEQKQVSPYCVDKAMAEIEEADYQRTLEIVLDKKWQQLKDPDQFVKRGKLAKYVISRGYEPELVWKTIRKLYMD